jgi:hypothetical protein
MADESPLVPIVSSQSPCVSADHIAALLLDETDEAIRASLRRYLPEEARQILIALRKLGRLS